MIPSIEPRAVCRQCRRPQVVCYCRHITSIPTATRVLLLQHPRERDKAIGTGRMASLCLPNAELHVGVDFQTSPGVLAALSDPMRPAVLLYPGQDASDIVESPPKGPVTLVVVDGTWWQARKIVRANPKIAALPRYTFVPTSPSEYRIRKEPSTECVSTIEALTYALGALEGSNASVIAALLAPFRAMVDAQIEWEKRWPRPRGRLRGERGAARKGQGPSLPEGPVESWVCVVGEANAWPYRLRKEGHPIPDDELVHWAAYRPFTGESFEFVLAPRHELAPSTPKHTGLLPETLAAGGTLGELFEGFASFLRDGDTLYSWGSYALSLFLKAGGHLPASRVDLREAVRSWEGANVGSLEQYAPRLDGAAFPEDPPRAQGRAGIRLRTLAALVRSMHREGPVRMACPSGRPSNLPFPLGRFP